MYFAARGMPAISLCVCALFAGATANYLAKDSRIAEQAQDGGGSGLPPRRLSDDGTCSFLGSRSLLTTAPTQPLHLEA